MGGLLRGVCNSASRGLSDGCICHEKARMDGLLKSSRDPCVPGDNIIVLSVGISPHYWSNRHLCFAHHPAWTLAPDLWLQARPCVRKSMRISPESACAWRQSCAALSGVVHAADGCFDVGPRQTGCQGSLPCAPQQHSSCQALSVLKATSSEGCARCVRTA